MAKRDSLTHFTGLGVELAPPERPAVAVGYLTHCAKGRVWGTPKICIFSWVLSAVNAAGKENHYSRHCGCSSDQKKKK